MIERYYELNQVKIRIVIRSGIAILTTNNPQITRQMYESAIKGGKKVYWEERQHAMIERFPIEPEETIAKMFDKDFATALKEQKKASKYAKEQKK